MFHMFLDCYQTIPDYLTVVDQHHYTQDRHCLIYIESRS